MTVAYQMLRPFAFMAVKGPTLHIYRTTVPAFITVGAVILLSLAPVPVNLIGERSAADYLATFFASLPGFYIAALAAVVAFSGGDLDKYVPDVLAPMTVNGDTKDNEITLRVFLSYLFAYLTVLSFIGFFVCIGGSLLSPSAVSIVTSVAGRDGGATLSFIGGLLYGGVLAFLSSSIVLCTVQGLYFLAERVHQTLN